MATRISLGNAVWQVLAKRTVMNKPMTKRFISTVRRGESPPAFSYDMDC